MIQTFFFFILQTPHKKNCALSNADRICSSVQLYPTDFSSTPSATASWSQFPILSWSTPFLLIGFKVPSWKTIFSSSLFPFTCLLVDPILLFLWYNKYNAQWRLLIYMVACRLNINIKNECKYEVEQYV